MQTITTKQNPPVAEYVVYGGARSLFTRKLTAALDFYGAPYRIEPRGPFARDELQNRANTHQIPLLHTPEDWILADTTPMLRVLDGRFPARRMFPEGLLGLLVSIVEEVLDEWVARVMVHYRWHNPENARYVLSQGAERELTMEEVAVHPMVNWGPRACRATGTEHPAQQRAAEQEYLGMLEALETQLGSTRYALGDRPSAVDTMILGGLRAHTNADPIPDLSGYTRVLEWEAACENGWDGQGELAPFPESTPFAQRMIALARNEYTRFVSANGQAREAGRKVFDIETYGEMTTYLAREYPERSRRLLKAHAFDTLSEQEHNQATEWLNAEGLMDIIGTPKS
ncbi:MAG: glutathione S-transferase family protein [Pseudomonadota bacterium]